MKTTTISSAPVFLVLVVLIGPASAVILIDATTNNGSFENNDISPSDSAGWADIGQQIPWSGALGGMTTIRFPLDALDGAQYLQYTNSINIGWGTPENSNFLPIDASKDYRASFWTRVPAMTTGTGANVRIRAAGPNGNSVQAGFDFNIGTGDGTTTGVQGADGIPYTNANGNWEKFEITITSATLNSLDQVPTHWLINGGGWAGQGPVDIDNFVLEHSPGGAPPDLEFLWKSDNFGEWTDARNWTSYSGPPGDPTKVSFSNHTATFGSAIMSNRTVIAETAVSVRAITFNNTNSYSIAGSGNVNLIEGTVAGAPIITVETGTHRFQTRVNFHANTTVHIDSDATLIFDGAVDLMGQTLTKTGSGEMAIRNDFLTGDGTLNCAQGTCSGSGTISGDVNNTGGTISPGNSALLSDGNNSVVPEPASIGLLLLGLIGVFGFFRRH